MGIYRILQDDELMHYGVKGMKWGKRKAKADYLTLYPNRPRPRKKNVTGQGTGLYKKRPVSKTASPIKAKAKAGELNYTRKKPTQAKIDIGRASWNKIHKKPAVRDIMGAKEKSAALQKNGYKRLQDSNKKALSEFKKENIKKNKTNSNKNQAPWVKYESKVKENRRENVIKWQDKQIKKQAKKQTIASNKKHKNKNRGSVKRQTK